MQPDFQTEGTNLGEDKKVFYVLKRDFGNKYVGEGDNFLMVRTVQKARRFASVADALAWLSTRNNAFSPPLCEIVRVEVITTAPRRKLVTFGDLSLLDGKCVISSHNNVEFVRDEADERRGWTTDLATARVFANVGDAVNAVARRSVRMRIAYHGLRPVPIREVPGESTFRETVLS